MKSPKKKGKKNPRKRNDRKNAGNALNRKKGMT